MRRAATMIAAAAVSALAASSLPGCGGDEREAEGSARRIVQALDERDPRLCDELVTQRFLERMTQRRGARARAACRRQLSRVDGTYTLTAVENVDVRGDEAIVVAAVETRGGTVTQRLELVRELDAFRLERAERVPAGP